MNAIDEIITSCLVRFQTSDAQIVGAGFLVENHSNKHLIITCAHVVNAALNQNLDKDDQPKDLVKLDFPCIAPDQIFLAEVIAWFPKQLDGTQDIAILQLKSAPPLDVKPAYLTSDQDYSNHRFKALGFPHGYERLGRYASGVLAGRLVHGRVQVQGVSAFGFFIEPGFSGTPIVDEELEGVIGIAASVDTPSDLRSASIIPGSSIRKLFSGLVPSLGKVFGNVQDLPHYYLRCEEEFRQLKKLLRTDAKANSIQKTLVLQGMGGSGKTSLAQDFIRDEQIRQIFSDGVFWFKIGQDSGDNQLINQMKAIGVHFSRNAGEEQARYFSLDSSCMRLQEVLRSKCCLIVLDDVWCIEHIYPFQNSLGKHCRLLVTSRIHSIVEGAKEINLGMLSLNQGEKLLQTLVGEEDLAFPDIVRRLGGLALAITLVGKHLGTEGISGREWLSKFERVSQIKYGGIQPTDPYKSLKVNIDLGINAAFRNNEENKNLYYSLGIFSKGIWIPEDIVIKLWRQINKNLDEDDCKYITRVLIDLGLLERNAKQKTINLHGLLHDYNRESLGIHYIKTQDALLIAHNPRSLLWYEVPLNNFLYMHLAYHLKEAKRYEELEGLLFNINWLKVKLDATDVVSLIADYDIAIAKYKQDSRLLDLSLVKGALQLSAYVLASEKDQLWEQLYGRLILLKDEFPRLELLLKDQIKKIWLRPLQPCLIPPGLPLLRTLQGHESTIFSVAMNAEVAISASDDHSLRVWNWLEGNLINTLRGHQYGVTSVALSLDGKKAISGSYDQTIKLWDLKTGNLLLTLLGNQGSIFSVTINANNKIALSGGQDGTIKVWDLAKGCETKVLRGHEGCVSSIAINADSSLAVSGSYDGTVKIWNLVKGQEILTLHGHTGAVLSVALHIDSTQQIVVSGSSDGTLKIWDLKTGAELGHLDSGWVNSIAISSNGEFILFGTHENNLKFWDFKAKKETRSLLGHERQVMTVALSPDNSWAISGSHDHTLKVWDLKIKKQQPGFLHSTRSIMSVATTEDGKTAFSGANDGVLEIYDIENQKVKRRLERQKWIVRSVALSADGSTAVAGLGDNSLRVFDTASAKEIKVFRGHSSRIRSVALSQNKQFVASGGDDTIIKVWSLETNSELVCFKGHRRGIGALCWGHNSTLLFSGSDDSTIMVWHLPTQKNLHILQGHDDEIFTLDISPDGTTLFSGSKDLTVKAWNIETGEELFTLRGHTSRVWSVKVNQTGLLLSSTSEDCTLRIWNLVNRQLVTSFHFDHSIFTCGFASDNILIIGGAAYRSPHFLKLER